MQDKRGQLQKKPVSYIHFKPLMIFILVRVSIQHFIYVIFIHFQFQLNKGSRFKYFFYKPKENNPKVDLTEFNLEPVSSKKVFWFNKGMNIIDKDSC